MGVLNIIINQRIFQLRNRVPSMLMYRILFALVVVLTTFSQSYVIRIPAISWPTKMKQTTLYRRRSSFTNFSVSSARRNSFLQKYSSRNDDASKTLSPSMKEEKHAELISSSKLSLAPMMEYTDRHFRKLVSLVSTKTLCYTEMVAANALVHERMDGKKKILMNDEHVEPDDPYRNQEQSQLDVQEFGYDMSYIRRFLGQYSDATPESIKRHNPTVSHLFILFFFLYCFNFIIIQRFFLLYG